jgi:periplasmic divalent cation tolerance protein
MKKTKKKTAPAPNPLPRRGGDRGRAVRVILVTAPEKEAERLARKLVEERLAACANLVPQVTSLYWWEGKLNRDGETLIILKTAPRLVTKLLKRMKELHSYQVPEFLALPVLEANPDYAQWVYEVTGDEWRVASDK